jgi:preprotein translocase subunit SecA
MGERIGMDITNVIWDRVVNIIETNDYEGVKEDFLKVLAMECPFTEEEFDNTPHADLEERAFQTAMASFKRHTDRIQSIAYPVIKKVEEEQGDQFLRIAIPFTDGKRGYQIACDLKEAYASEGKSVVKDFEKFIMLHIIDDAWKENLRQLDELKHSVQNASYEQKDPLLVFKLESVKVFDSMVNEMNNRIASILMRIQIPELSGIQEAPQEIPQEAPQYHEQKDDFDEAAQRAAANQDTREGAGEPNHTPFVKEKMPRRNDPCPCGSGKKFKDCHGKGLV